MNNLYSNDFREVAMILMDSSKNEFKIDNYNKYQ